MKERATDSSGAFEPIGRARFRPDTPRHIYAQAVYDDERNDQKEQGVLLAETNSAELARWLVIAINACIDGTPLDTPRPSGKVLRHGSIELFEDEFLDLGWHYCAAYGVASSSGRTLGRSKDNAHTQAIADRLTTLLAASD